MRKKLLALVMVLGLLGSAVPVLAAEEPAVRQRRRKAPISPHNGSAEGRGPHAERGVPEKSRRMGKAPPGRAALSLSKKPSCKEFRRPQTAE